MACGMVQNMKNSKYILGTEENLEFQRSIRRNLIEFGRRFPSPTGGSYWLSDDGTPETDRDRETWITCRMIHVYSIASIMGDRSCAALAEAGIAGLRGELKDSKNGGWFRGVTKEGKPLEDKQCYAHAFVMLAASSALLAGINGAGALLSEAEAVYDKYFWDADAGLAKDTWNTEFTELSSYRGINANMHTVEAFLAIADATGDDKYRESAGGIIRRVVEWASENEWRIPEHFTEDWKPDLEYNADRKDDKFKPYGATPGHGIEWARLITQWATSVYGAGAELEKYISAAEALFDRAVADAWNADGAPGIVYTTDWQGNPVVHDRMHWTLAEAINTSAVLYNTTGKQAYADLYAEFMKYLDECVLDHKNGSWFHQLDRENRPIGTVWPGKSDLYHAFQSTIIPFIKQNISIASGVSAE